MNQLVHLQKNKDILDKRWQIIRSIREFFWRNGFQEVEAPTIVRFAGQEPYLSPVKTKIHNEKGNAVQGYLHTSPEYAMKKYLAVGYKNIFYLGKTFRDYESFGGLHNPEFTMIEWYRTNADMFVIMDDIEKLLQTLFIHKHDKKGWNIERISMVDLWKQYIKVDLNKYLTTQSMYELCRQRGFLPAKEDAYEHLFYKIFLNEIEPQLSKKEALMVYHYPKQMAALAKISQDNRNYAERFELYIHGIEIANAFSELTNANEQRERFVCEQKQREQFHKQHIPLDEEFLFAVEHLPDCAGIALGVDRLAQVLLGEKSLDNLLPFGAKQLWQTQ